MQQAEGTYMGADDKKELTKQIKFLSGKVEEFKFPEDIKELRRLRRLMLMQQAEGTYMGADDKKELTKQIKFLSGKVEEFKFPEDIKELRRLRRLM